MDTTQPDKSFQRARGTRLPSQEDPLRFLPFTLASVGWSPGRTARSRPKEVKGRLLNKEVGGRVDGGKEGGREEQPVQYLGFSMKHADH